MLHALSRTSAFTLIFLQLAGCAHAGACPAAGYEHWACRAHASDRSAYLPFGKVLETGDSVHPPDCKRAAIYYKAAAKGDKGGIYAWSPAAGGVNSQLRVFKGPSAQPSGEAAYRLGKLYERGCGVPLDEKRARQLFAKALAAGYDAGPATK